MPGQLYQFAEQTEEINKFAGKIVYALCYEGNVLVTTRMAAINDFMKDNDLILNFVDDQDNFKIFYGILLNPEILPQKLPTDKQFENCELILLRYNNYNCIEVDDSFSQSIEMVIDDIEHRMERDHNLEIDDFSVLYGRRVDLIIQVKPPGFIRADIGGLV